MNIILAKHAGFCFGVRRAVEITKETARKVYNESADAGESAERPRVFTYGELIHNKTVVEELASEGITAIASPEEAQAGDYVVIRSHGVPASVYAELEARGINCVDATCPFVARIHETVAEADTGRSLSAEGRSFQSSMAARAALWCRPPLTTTPSAK